MSGWSVTKMSEPKSKTDNIESIYPLSPTQEGMLFHTLLAPGSGIYLDQMSFRLTNYDESSREILRQVFQVLIERHSALRTAFVWERREKPLQIVFKKLKVPIEDLDWRGFGEEEQERRFADFLRADRQRGVKLSQPPLLRLTLIVLADGVCRVVWSYHHMLLDGWSMALLMREIMVLSSTLLQGVPASLEKPRAYRDYITWLQQQDMTEVEVFWRRELAGFTAPTPFGVDHPAPEGPGDHYKTQPLRFSVQQTMTFQGFVRQHRLTLSNLVQGAWALLLSRYSGEPDVVFGITVSGRPDAISGIESMIGLFINSLACRVRIGAEETVVEWLKGLQTKQFQLSRFEHSPLQQVQGWSELPRNTQLFNSLLVFENTPPAFEGGIGALVGGRESNASPVLAKRLPDLQDTRYETRTNYPLTLLAVPTQALEMMLIFDRRRFEAVTMSRMAQHIERILDGLLQRPDLPCTEIPLLTPAERQQALLEWNDTAAPYPASFNECLAEQVGRTPDAVAASCGDAALTYRELDRRVGRAAARLSRLGVGPEDVVAILSWRGLDFLVTLLAVLRAGGVYLPLDPRHPPLRRAQVLARSGARTVVAADRHDAALAESLDEIAGSPRPGVVLLEDLLAGDGEEGAPSRRELPSQLAYVIYTSGTTGVPKGPMVDHAGLINHLNLMASTLDLREGDVVAQTASQCFDISIWQFLTPLLVGARVHIVPDEIVQDPSRLIGELVLARVSIFEPVPSLLQILLDEVEERAGGSGLDLSRLRWVIPTGEAVPAELCRRWFETFPRVPLLNAYGPAECADDVSFHVLREAAPDEGASVSIGRPVENLRLYLLDADVHPQPRGVAGEIFVGGEGVGRGYAGDPATTAASFVPDPFAAEAGRRLYRTGDLGRYLEDGRLDFLGRSDHQVKVRGFRIEPGDVEAVLCQHPGLRQAVVVAREEKGGKILVAYVVSAPAAPAPGTGELRGFLGERLPEYMVPAAFVVLESLPLTANGKVDRRALPAPGNDLLASRSQTQAPRDEVERRLVAIWEELLGLAPIGIADSFFELGGHSLLAVRLMSRLRRDFDFDLPLAPLFQQPTIEHLATILRGRALSPRHQVLVSLRPDGARRPLFCVHPVGGNVFCYLELVSHLPEGRSVYGLQSPDPVADAEVFTGIKAMAAHYLRAVREVQPEGPYLLCGWSTGGVIAFEMARQLRAAGEEIGLLALLDAHLARSGERSQELTEAEMILLFARDLAGLSGEELASLPLEGPDLLARLHEMARASGLLAADVDLEMARYHYTLFEKNFRAWAAYEGGGFDGEILLVRPRGNLLAFWLGRGGGAEDPLPFWKQLAGDRVEVQHVPGDHHSILRGKGAREIAELLARHPGVLELAPVETS